ncbi:MAG: hypothetical protein ACRDS0_05280 [Pseudonocardiaceae bacterium]
MTGRSESKIGSALGVLVIGIALVAVANAIPGPSWFRLAILVIASIVILVNIFVLAQIYRRTRMTGKEHPGTLR